MIGGERSSKVIKGRAGKTVFTASACLFATALWGTISAAVAVANEPQAACQQDVTLFSAIARRQNPAIVSITTTSRSRPYDLGEEDVFRGPGVSAPPADGRVYHAAGSGFIIGKEGEILTNHHVVNDADTIEVSLFGDERKRYRAERVGSDPLTDTALIRLVNPPADLPTVTIGDSSRLEPGDWVMAIGNPLQLGHTVTVGVISYNGRPIEVHEGRWQDMIQTDAAINPGNSGGPLIDVHGNVVGINVALVDDQAGGIAGIGFAVPMNSVMALLPQLRHGKVVRGQLGVELQGGPILEDEARELGLPEATGAIVMTVYSGSAAARAGLRAGDVVVEVDGRKVADTRALLALGSSLVPGTETTVKAFRDGQKQTRAITIEEMPIETETRAPRSKPNHDDGITLANVSRGKHIDPAAPRVVDGALVVNVVDGSAADEAELSAGDIIRAINRLPVHTAAEARRRLHSIESDRPVFLLVWRNGAELFLRLRRQ